ncbi:sulfotransferase 1C4-like [Amyelois transitella]|uniref:sulfotransferase 1C4-like n=1 Tax=Amyelois transitella TaxID=680683 RepID=UPI0029902265|nr:sulfotransferase 1C4-like [Amyelois transitella]
MTEKSYPLEIRDAPPELVAEIRKYSNGAPMDYIQVGPQKYIFPSGFRNECMKLYNMELRPDDVFVATFPKSGTTWTQELVWLIGNNFDYETAAKIFLKERFPFIELPMMLSDPKVVQWARDQVKGDSAVNEAVMKMFSVPMMEVVAKLPSPRFIKTHLPFSMLPPSLLDTVKVVYVARDPRDVAVSYYHHSKLFKLKNFQGDFPEFWQIFLKDGFDWCPYFAHVKEAWAKRGHPNLLFLFYEELYKDLPAAVRRVAKFLQKPVSEEQVSKLCDHLHIDNFRKNKSVNSEEMQEIGFANKTENFIRKGKAGGWRAYFDYDMTLQAERWMQENLRDTDLRFPTKD